MSAVCEIVATVSVLVCIFYPLYMFAKADGYARRWKAVAVRNRRWFKAELSGSNKGKKRGDDYAYRLHLAGRCLFCGEPFWQGERVTWLPAHRRGYCDSCRDELDAAERQEEEAEARMDAYVRRGVAMKDFY